MINKLKELNPEIEFYSIHDEELKKYGRLLDFDPEEFLNLCNNSDLPENGSKYSLSVDKLENANSANTLKERLFGGRAAQIGLCCGYNTYMNALEFHNSAEINVAVTPMVLLLGLRYEMDGADRSVRDIIAFLPMPG